MFSIITGNAGTGKSYLLSKYINNVINKNNSFVVLAFTHTAVNNIKNICLNNIDDKNKKILDNKFMTIHKYFHINIETNKIAYYKFDKLDIMFIDEYSFISIDLFKLILPIIFNTVKKVVLCGDYKQIKTVDYNNNISYDILFKYVNNINFFNKYSIYPIRHYENSILSLKDIQNNLLNCIILKENHRSNNNILNIVNEICFNNINDENITFTQHSENIKKLIDKYIINKDNAIKLIANNNYCFIASKYKYLKNINHLVNKYQCIKDSYNIINGSEEIKNYTIHNIITPDINIIDVLKIRQNELIKITENTNEFINGEEYIFKEYNKDNKYVLLMDKNEKYYYLSPISKTIDNINICYYPILPSYLSTFHKAQGLSIDNVIICLDSLFDFTLLYTGITRARNNIKFFIFNESKYNNIIDKIGYINEQYDYLNKIFDTEFIDKNKDKIIYK